jgi:two-component system, OmpR family, response regulator
MIALMVEDSPLVRQRLIPMLAAFSGVKVVATAASEAEALQWLRHNRCDLVLLDLRLRRGSGLGLLDRIGSESRGGGHVAPLRVVLTNGATAAVRRHCEALGATAVFDKSIQLDELFDFLRREHVTLH